MEEEQLEARLAALEAANEKAKQDAELNTFMQLYGSKINGHEGLGLAMLEELHRRGIDVSAAGETVQAIIAQLMNEANMLLEALRGNTQQAVELTNKLQAVDEAVASATAKEGINSEISTAPDVQGTPLSSPIAAANLEGGAGAEVPPQAAGDAAEGEIPQMDVSSEEVQQMPEEEVQQMPEEEVQQMPEEMQQMPAEDTQRIPQNIINAVSGL